MQNGSNLIPVYFMCITFNIKNNLNATTAQYSYYAKTLYSESVIYNISYK